MRAYNGTASRWHRTALAQQRGRIRGVGINAVVTFTPVDGDIDAAYSEKYASSPYLQPMVSARTRGATMRLEPVA